MSHLLQQLGQHKLLFKDHLQQPFADSNWATGLRPGIYHTSKPEVLLCRKDQLQCGKSRIPLVLGHEQTNNVQTIPPKPILKDKGLRNARPCCPQLFRRAAEIQKRSSIRLCAMPKNFPNSKPQILNIFMNPKHKTNDIESQNQLPSLAGLLLIQCLGFRA